MLWQSFFSAGSVLPQYCVKENPVGRKSPLGEPLLWELSQAKEPGKRASFGGDIHVFNKDCFNYLRLKMNFFRRLCYKYVVVSSTLR